METNCATGRPYWEDASLLILFSVLCKVPINTIEMYISKGTNDTAVTCFYNAFVPSPNSETLSHNASPVVKVAC